MRWMTHFAAVRHTFTNRLCFSLIPCFRISGISYERQYFRPPLKAPPSRYFPVRAGSCPAERPSPFPPSHWPVLGPAALLNTLRLPPSRGMPHHVRPRRRLEPVFRRLWLPGDLPHRGRQLPAGEGALPGEGGHQVVRSLGRCSDRLGARQPGILK